MSRLVCCTIGCLACVTMASVADAQMVRVGPFGGVSIRAPFVSVDTLPFGGGARVRAPFTSVDTRAFAYGYGYGYRPDRYDYYRPYGGVFYNSATVPPAVPVYPVPVYTPPLYPDVVYPTPDYKYPQTRDYQVARPRSARDASAGLPERLRASALQLKRSLSVRRDDSEVWIHYLAPDRIVQTIDSGAASGSLSDLLLNYDGVIGNASLSSIRAASGFNETHGLLRAFVETKTTELPPNVEPANDAVPVPAPVATTSEPTLAQPIRPADGKIQGGEQTKEELPLPDPTPL